MIDDLALLLVHGSLAILIWRLIKTPDPDNQAPPRLKPSSRFRRPDRIG